MIDYSDCRIIYGPSAKDVKHEFLSYSISQCKIKNGCALEFGVASGESLKLIAKESKLLTIGFDSWDGLPADWDVGDNVLEKGTFKTKMPDPMSLGRNTILVKGLFNDTLPGVCKTLNFNASFVHIDCDLFSSAWCVLENLNTNLVPGSVIAFDEVENFANTLHKSTNKDNEKLALLTWLERHNRRVKPICRTNWYQAAFEVIS